jgi:predicted DCC family thiol-disulfide oxidoreductase YuxK
MHATMEWLVGKVKVVPLDAGMSGVHSWVNSTHFARWCTVWSICLLSKHSSKTSSFMTVQRQFQMKFNRRHTHTPARSAISQMIQKSQVLTGLIFVEDTTTNQWYLQKMQNEIILVILWDGACPNTENVILDILYDVFGSCIVSDQFPVCFGCGWSWPPCSPHVNPCNYFL